MYNERTEEWNMQRRSHYDDNGDEQMNYTTLIERHDNDDSYYSHC